MIDTTGGGYYAERLAAKGITYIGSFHNGFRQLTNSKTVVDAFGLPEYMVPVMMLGLGYPNDRAKAHQAHFDREPVGNFVTEL